ncbi:hypothetical protein [Corynebacterium sp.]|uniref:hypothetical protein n=1 Tax=Corynebacterium sp. TaxID=1720 RepID=UPI0028A89736|nr:hypothetical protein [Corynebacterium sp.]
MSNTYHTIHAAITEALWCYEDGPPVMTGELREQVEQIVAAACERIEPAPQVIHKPAELEALDPDTLLSTVAENDHGDLARSARMIRKCYLTDDNTPAWPLPAVVVATGEYVRACREALEGGAT